MSALIPWEGAPLRRDRLARAASNTIAMQSGVSRSRDEARAELAAARISDLAKVTRHGIGAAALIAYEAEVAVQMSPWAADQIAGVATTGIAGIRGVISDLASGL
jgi:hypothetical protein